MASSIPQTTSPFILIPRLFQFYREQVGAWIYLFLLVLLVNTLLDGIGVVMVLPLLSTAGSGSVDLAQFKPIQWLLGVFGYQSLTMTLGQVLLVIVLAFVGKLVFVLGSILIRAKILVMLSTQLRRGLVLGLKNLRYEAYTKLNQGEMNNVLISEVERAEENFKQFNGIIVLSIQVVVYLLLSLIIDWKLVVLVMVASAITVPGLSWMNHFMVRISSQIVENSGRLQHHTGHFLAHLKYLKAIDHWKFLGSFQKNIRHHARLRAMRDAANLAVAGFVEPITVITMAGYIYYTVVVNGQPLSTVLVAGLFLQRTSNRVLGLPKTWAYFLGLVQSSETIRRVNLSLKRDAEVGEGQNEQVLQFQSAVEFKNISFNYGDKNVFRDLTLKLNKNQSIGIVGQSGAGKTTFFDLIVGLLKPTSGGITLDGQDYAAIHPSSLRKLFGYVTQEPVIFDDTVKNNISLWDEGDKEEVDRKVRHAAELAGCHGFVSELAQGYDTFVGDRGIRLSGGQRQRLTIARELYRDSEIIILDEATSSLDSQSESLIHDSMERLMGKKTLLIISHRLAAVRNCDYIYVIENHSIREQGTWKELLANPASQLAQLYNMQTRQSSNPSVSNRETSLS